MSPEEFSAEAGEEIDWEKRAARSGDVRVLEADSVGKARELQKPPNY
jgi:hypothetical protein